MVWAQRAEALRNAVAVGSVAHVLSWWTLSTKSRQLSISATVSAKHPRIGCGFAAV
jgi:hypothetical protein